ncbi:MAG: hypothetical protein DRI57_12090 [Deltaproteobacteria bacterium]|nr:MAG: hypothetical protein DRI57_12090 [Deltaproteobacteria bacterium]
MSNLSLDHRYSHRVAKSGGGLDSGNPGRERDWPERKYVTNRLQVQIKNCSITQFFSCQAENIDII